LDVLGDVSATRLGDRTARVHLPRLRGEDPILIQPAVLDPLIEEPSYVDGTDPERDTPTSPWGWSLFWKTADKQTSLAISQVVVTLEPYQKLGPPPASLQVTRTVARVSDKAP